MTTLIHNVTELQNINLDLAGDYELANDIDCTGFSFVPIGNYINWFAGSLDGKGHIISNITFNMANPGVRQFFGLFSLILGSVSNLVLDTIRFNIGNFSSAGSIGCLCGQSNGIISNVQVTGLSGAIGGTNASLGMLCGINSGTITRCSTGSTTIAEAGGSSNFRVSLAGGLVGGNGGAVSDCFSRSVVAISGVVLGVSDCGGFCGLNSATATVQRSYSTGQVFSGAWISGGFCGRNYNAGGITSCFWDTDTSGTLISDGGTGEHTAWMKTESNFVAAGWDFTTPIWAILPAYNNGYPYLPQVVLPTVSSLPATTITQIQATLNGTLTDDGGEACDCGFEWGLTPAYGNITSITSQTTGESFSQVISGLTLNTTYHFRALATNSVGTSYGADMTFITSPGPPILTTLPATGNILNGLLDNDGGAPPCYCYFQWGVSQAYGNNTPKGIHLTGDTFSQAISGLTPGVTYHFRAVAYNALGTTYGNDLSFTYVVLPAVVTSAFIDLTTTSTELYGILDDDGGEACDCGFQWGLTQAYGNTTPTTSQITGDTFSQLISGLAPDTFYHFRAFATNSSGTSYGADVLIYTGFQVGTLPATNITSSSALLVGELIFAGVLPRDCYFQLGNGQTTPLQSLSLSGSQYGYTISGLQPTTDYRFRAVATSGGVTVYGDYLSFTTLANIPVPVPNFGGGVPADPFIILLLDD